MDAFIEIDDSRVKLDVVDALRMVFGNLLDSAKDPSGDQKDTGPLLDLAKGQVGDCLHIQVACRKKWNGVLEDVELVACFRDGQLGKGGILTQDDFLTRKTPG